MTGFAFTIVLSAFLLFQVQPMIGRFILPWFGGSPAVWTTCLLFFQIALLGGYLYSHLLVRAFTVRTQTLIHTGVLLLSLATLPILPDPRLRPTGQEDPVARILIVLAVTIGLPYCSTSTTGPLLQSWFTVTCPNVSPWRLFALSNLGSLVALLSYPFVFEPRLSQTTQALCWSGAYAVFVLTTAATAIQVRRRLSRQSSRQADVTADNLPSEQPVADNSTGDNAATGELATGELVGGELVGGECGPGDRGRPTAPGLHRAAARLSFWVLLSLFPSVLLLATTNQICQEVAVVPFLWILPLALYLITFIVSFDRPQYYIRFLAVPVMLASVGGGCALSVSGTEHVPVDAGGDPLRRHVFLLSVLPRRAGAKPSGVFAADSVLSAGVCRWSPRRRVFRPGGTPSLRRVLGAARRAAGLRGSGICGVGAGAGGAVDRVSASNHAPVLPEDSRAVRRGRHRSDSTAIPALRGSRDNTVLPGASSVGPGWRNGVECHSPAAGLLRDPDRA